MAITRKELIKKYIDFFKSKDHKEIPNSSLVPQNDPTVLFTTAGMHPLVPFLLGQKHPSGKRLVNVQRCIRTGDIDEVGDTCHHTFFEMLGNWSLGDYFKKEAITWSFEFITKELKIPLERFAVTVFEGDKDSPKDEESAKIWQSLGIKKERIAFLPKKDNWWGPAGNTGPCGPDTEMFYWSPNEIKPTKFDPKDKRWVEIWNDVLMQYLKDEKGNYIEAKQKNIDTGMGVERTLAVLNNLEDNYQTEVFLPIIKEIEKLSKKKYNINEEDNTRAFRIIADHIKASIFIIADGVTPSNTERGYVLRRLIRRAIRYGHFLNIKQNFTTSLVDSILGIYEDYSELKKKRNQIITELDKEENRFRITIEEGLKQTEKIFSNKTPIDENKYLKLMKNPNKASIIGRALDLRRENRLFSIKEPKITQEEIEKATITGEETFLLYQSYGFPIEMIDELAMAKGLFLSHQDFRNELLKHQELSRTASAGAFKSGLADNSEQTTKLHTATHLLNEALKQVLNKSDLHQKGSNITPERTRFDFNFDRKLTEEEIKKVQDWVNDIIKQELEVKREELKYTEAIKQGAKGEFGTKYPEIVSVYTILNEKGKPLSKEICTGPHVKNTKELGHFKILKQESSSAGVRRIKAILE